MKTKILEKIWAQILNPTPPGKGGIKNEVIEKLVGELKLQNMIFRTHNNKTKFKRWALYIKNWARYKHFSNSTYGYLDKCHLDKCCKDGQKFWAKISVSSYCEKK